MNTKEILNKMEFRLKIMQENYESRNYFGNLSDLLADIVSLEVKIDRHKESMVTIEEFDPFTKTKQTTTYRQQRDDKLTGDA